MPVRVQLSRAKGWRMPPNTVVVSRPSMWGNPWRPGNPGTFWLPGFPVRNAPILHEVSQKKAERLCRCSVQFGDAVPRNFLPLCLNDEGVRRAAAEVDAHGAQIRANFHKLRGKNLACWCGLDQNCHADVLLEMANA